ncbi:MAG: ComEA family DNA-binding protein [Microbacteriaceae bacterium]
MTVDPDAAGDAERLALLAPGARRTPRTVRLRLGIGAAAVLVIGALVVTVVISLLAPASGSQSVAAVTAQTGATGQSGATGDPTGPANPGVLYVHVLGAVSSAGLYQLRTGARVVDAVAAAGGFTADANQGGVNLARAMTDGEQLIVPKIGEPAAEPAAGAPGSGAAPGGKVNLNTASQAELETLPHVGPATAARILQWRTDNGRFSTVDDLMAVSGIGTKTFEALKDLVSV